MTENIKDFKKIMSHFATGICVLTVLNEEKPGESGEIDFIGLTINSFNSVSLEPPLILYSLGKSSSNFENFLNAENFFINILSESQEEISNFFAFQKDFSKFKDFEIECFGPDKKKFVKIKNCLGGIACEKYKDYEGGDHRIILGKTIGFDLENYDEDIEKKKPLIYFGSKYRGLSEKIN